MLFRSSHRHRASHLTTPRNVSELSSPVSGQAIARVSSNNGHSSSTPPLPPLFSPRYSTHAPRLALIGSTHRADLILSSLPPRPYLTPLRTMALRPSLSFLRIGSISSPHTLELYLDTNCPFSAKLVNSVDSNIVPRAFPTPPQPQLYSPSSRHPPRLTSPLFLFWAWFEGLGSGERGRQAA